MPDDKNKGTEGSDSDFYNSQVSSVGVIQSADGNVSHTSLQSNDNGYVGKSETDGKHSESPHNDISAHSDSTPSSYAEADGSQNEGKRKDEAPAQQEGQPPHPDGIPSNGNGGYSQKSNGYNHSNGS